jgi:hypothetical protein
MGRKPSGAFGYIVGGLKMAKRPYQMTIGEFIKSSLLQVGDPTEFHAQWTLNTEAEKLPKGVSVKSMVQGVIIKVYTVASGAFKGDRMADIKTTPEPPWKGKIAKEVPMDEISYGPKHEALIKEALDAGKPVSSAILKDYPDLEAEIQSKRESILMKPPTLIPEEVFSKVPKQGKARIRYTYDKIMKPIQAEVKRIQKQPDGGAANLEKIQRHYKKIATAFKPYQLPYGEWSARIAAFRVSHFGKQHSVYQILSSWTGSESLKELFWSELNYDRVNQPLSRHNFPKGANDALADAPLLFAESNEFRILYCRLASDRLRLTDERAVVNHLLQQHPYVLFVFSDDDQTNWHFVNVKEGAEKAKKTDKQQRKIIRRIAVGPEERLRTAAERIAMLDVETIQPTLKKN